MGKKILVQCFDVIMEFAGEDVRVCSKTYIGCRTSEDNNVF